MVPSFSTKDFSTALAISSAEGPEPRPLLGTFPSRNSIFSPIRCIQFTFNMHRSREGLDWEVLLIVFGSPFYTFDDGKQSVSPSRQSQFPRKCRPPPRSKSCDCNRRI